MKSQAIRFLRVAGATLLASALALPLLAADTTKPNVIFILADDLGYGDLGCFGQKKIRTPHLDKMAKEGIKLTDHYSGQAVCSPSRASLMLGQHMGHCPMTNNQGRSLGTDDVTLPRIFQAAGYKTGMIGKWGLNGRNPSGEQQGRLKASRCGRVLGTLNNRTARRSVPALN